MTVLIAGGGIVGLSLALTCHEIGVDVKVFEAVDALRPLGVGINLQPNAVKELFQLGLEPDLRDIGIEAEEWALFFYGAHPIWQEARGTLAGYAWPQFSVHRGAFQMRLLQAVQKRLGDDCVVTNARLSHYVNEEDHVVAHFTQQDGTTFSVSGDLLIGADGIHSAVRSQMYPQETGVNWNGAIMWRGVSRMPPPRTRNSFIMVGGMTQRFVCYPLEPVDDKGETLLNWIAELRPDTDMIDQSDWNRPASADAFMNEFTDWTYDWLNVPAIVDRAQGIWEFPMVDRDPVESWVDDRVALIGDAAHAMFPHGSGGATQGIVDTRVLGACIQEFGEENVALQAYDRRLRESVNELVVRNRGEGPIGVLLDIEARLAAGQTLDKAIDQEAIAAFMAAYKDAAGTARDTLNRAAPIIAFE